MIYDQPDLREIDRMIEFCRSHGELYIYGCEEKQILLEQYLRQAGIRPDGYVISNRGHFETEWEGTPIYTLEELAAGEKKSAGILLALPGCYYNDVLVRLQGYGFTELFYMSEYNKRTIAYKMRPRARSNFWMEVNVADHCNLNCQMCDHFSQIAEESYLSLEECERDFGRMAELAGGHIGILKLLGGEPLLHREVGQIIRTARSCFPRTRIFLYTNGIKLLDRDYYRYDLWELIRENDIEVQVTQYPIHFDYAALDRLAEDYGVKYSRFVNEADRDDRTVKVSVKHPFDLSGGQDGHSFISCYHFNSCITLRHGRIYTCPIIAYSEFFNKFFHQGLETAEGDSMDIYQAENLDQIARFVTRRPDFCRYCNVRGRCGGYEWRNSTKLIDEYT